MEYRSPLGFNFKLEQSLSASKEDKSKETPKKVDSSPLETGSGSRKPFNFDNRRNQRDSRNSQQDYSPGWQRHSNNWKSPNPRNSGDDVPISQFYNPSMLEDPWEELEKNLK